MNRHLKFLSLAFLPALLACTEQHPVYPLRTPPPGYEAPAAVAAGATLFRQKCAGCHGHPDEGRSPRANALKPTPPDFLSADYRSVDPAYLFWRIRNGKTVEPYLSQGSVMPAWNDHLDDRSIWQLVAYLRSRSR